MKICLPWHVVLIGESGNSHRAYIVNGIRFSNVARDSNKRTRNSGVMTEGEHDRKVIDFYGTLKEIIQLDYNSNDNSDGRSVILFKCDCLNLMERRRS